MKRLFIALLLLALTHSVFAGEGEQIFCTGDTFTPLSARLDSLNASLALMTDSENIPVVLDALGQLQRALSDIRAECSGLEFTRANTENGRADAIFTEGVYLVRLVADSPSFVAVYPYACFDTEAVELFNFPALEEAPPVAWTVYKVGEDCDIHVRVEIRREFDFTLTFDRLEYSD